MSAYFGYSTYFGYGVDLSKLSLENLEGFMKSYDPEYYEDMLECLEYTEQDATDEDIFDFLNDYSNEYGYYGISAYLSDIINKKEELELGCYDNVVNGYIYVPMQYPWDGNQNMRNLTREKVQEIFEKYLSGITKNEIVCEELVMYVDNMA
jgi:hypothetical protein